MQTISLDAETLDDLRAVVRGLTEIGKRSALIEDDSILFYQATCLLLRLNRGVVALHEGDGE
jgi:hypothetical protein